jgi:O-antigen ligase
MNMVYARWSVLAFSFSIPWQNAIVYPQFGTISSVLGVIMFGVVAVGIAYRGRVRRPSLFLVLFAVLVWWLAMTYFWSVDPVASLTRTLTFLQLLAMTWIVHEICRDTRTRDQLFMAYVLGCFVVIAATVQAVLMGQISADPWAYRVAAEGFNPNGVAIVLALGVPMAWHNSRNHPSGSMRIISALYLPAMLIGLLLTASRTGLLAAAVAFTVVPLTLLRRRQLIRAVITVSLVIVTATVAVVAAWPQLKQYGLGRNLDRLVTVATLVSQGDLGERGAIWAEGIRMYADRPLLGYGNGGFRVEMEHRTGIRIAGHNAFITLWVESGAIGGMLFMLLLIAVARSFRGLHSRERALHVVLFATIVLVLVPSNTESHKAVWLILVLLTMARNEATERLHNSAAARAEVANA